MGNILKRFGGLDPIDKAEKLKDKVGYVRLALFAAVMIAVLIYFTVTDSQHRLVSITAEQELPWVLPRTEVCINGNGFLGGDIKIAPSLAYWQKIANQSDGGTPVRNAYTIGDLSKRKFAACYRFNGTSAEEAPPPEGYTCSTFALWYRISDTYGVIRPKEYDMYHDLPEKQSICVDIYPLDENSPWSVLSTIDDMTIYFDVYLSMNFSFFWDSDSYNPLDLSSKPGITKVVLSNSIYDQAGAQFQYDLGQDVRIIFTKSRWTDANGNTTETFSPTITQSPRSNGLSRIDYNSNATECKGAVPCVHVRQAVSYQASTLGVFQSVQETDTALAQRIITSTTGLFGVVGTVLTIIFSYIYRIKFYPKKDEAIPSELRNSILHLIRQEMSSSNVPMSKIDVKEENEKENS